MNLMNALKRLSEHSDPMCGSDLIIAALNMPIVQCRTQAIRTISEWCKTKDCSLLDLSNDLYQAVEHLKSVEVDDRVKKMIEENKLSPKK